ncbi:MAG: hypothetical protein O3B86_07535 [Planctomycetota bacterium]|nr:hypothetical protein [Planctomycetota bacterium]
MTPKDVADKRLASVNQLELKQLQWFRPADESVIRVFAARSGTEMTVTLLGVASNQQR